MMSSPMNVEEMNIEDVTSSDSDCDSSSWKQYVARTPSSANAELTSGSQKVAPNLSMETVESAFQQQCIVPASPLKPGVVPQSLGNSKSDSMTSWAASMPKLVSTISSQKGTCQESTQKSLFVPKYLPVTKEDLAVSKPKVVKLEEWIVKASKYKKFAGILVLSGPTGSGKTTAVQAIAASLNIRVMEWVTPMDEFQDVNCWPSAKQSSKFTDFLMGSSRYEPVIGPANTNKIILVEDYPNVFLQSPEVFHSILKQYFERGKCPIVFITSDESKKISRDLFPERLIQEARIEEINFNPVAATLMSKAMERLSRLGGPGGVDAIDAEEREAICLAASGDLRYAINTWHYRNGGASKSVLSCQESKVSKRRGKNHGPRAKKRKKSRNTAAQSIDTKDPGSEKLHSIGRVLYAKREPVAVPGGSRDPDKRGFLRNDPEMIVDQYLSDSRSFIEMVHQNYLALFSDIDSVAKAADYLSISDSIMPDYRLDLEHLREASFTIAVRGTMHSCNNPILKWYPLQKSKLREVAQKAERFLQKVKDTYSGSPYSLTTALLDMIPLTENLEKVHHFDKHEDPSKSPIPHITDSEEEDD